MAVWFTSDTHFGHRSMVTQGWRPFALVEHMDEVLIDRWNAHVSRGDTVYHLGDFTLGGLEMAKHYRHRLNGKIHLIWGNHDRPGVRKAPFWSSSQYAAEIRVNGRRVVLCHYAMEVWNNCHHGSLMLHGHSHGNLLGNSQRLDVGVDAWDFAPVSMDRIEAALKLLPPFRAGDHHVPRE